MNLQQKPTDVETPRRDGSRRHRARHEIGKIAHREPADAVVVGARLRRRARPEPGRGATAPGAIRAEPAEERAGNAVVEAAARAVRELPGDHPARRHRHLGGRMAAAGPARERAPLRGDRHPGDRRAQRHARLHPGGARREIGARADGACRPRSDGGARRRAPAHRDPRDRPRRHRPGRGRRQDPGRCPPHRGGEPPHRRGAADRREHAGGEGRAADRRAMSASATAATCCTPARSPPMAAAAPSSSRPAWATEVGRIAGLLEAAEKEPTPLQQELDRTGKRLSVIMLAICAVVFAAGLFSTTDVHAQRRAQPVPVRGGARGRRHPRGAAGDRDRRPEPRRAAHGGGQCHRAQAAGGRDARRRDRDLLRQDRHADAQRDDRARDRCRPARSSTSAAAATFPRANSRSRASRSPSSRRMRDAVEQTLRAAALANDAALVQQRGPLARAGRPDRRRADRRGAQVRHRRSRARALSAHRRNPLHLRAQAPHHRPSSIRENPERAARLRQGRARNPARRSAATCGRTARSSRSATTRRAELAAAQRRARRARRCARWPSRRAPCRPRRSGSIRRRRRQAHVDIELPESIEDDLVLLGFVGMIDPPRTEVKDAVAVAKRAHIRTVMITGDHPATAEAIARELDIFEPGARLVTGSRAAHHGRRRARRDRRGGARVRPRRSRAQAAHRRARCSARATSSP